MKTTSGKQNGRACAAPISGRAGWTPRIQTYPGREVPNPLVIDISKGETDINVVLKHILALTK